MANRGSSSGGWILVVLVVLGLSQCFRTPDSSSSSNIASRQTASSTPASPAVVSPPASTSVSNGPTSSSQIRYVTASALNMRASPSTSADIVGKLPNGQQITVIGQESDWFLVQIGSSQGWVSGRYTSTSRPAQPSAPAPQPAAVANINRSQIVQQIIERSIRNYSGSCPCPYNTDRAGRRCGQRSAYSRPGGRSPICYPDQVTEAMIAAFLR